MLAIPFSIAAICVAAAFGARFEDDAESWEYACCCQKRRAPVSLTGCDTRDSFVVDRGTKAQCCRTMKQDLCEPRGFSRVPYLDTDTWVIAQRQDQCSVGIHAHGLGEESENYKVTDGWSKEARLAAHKCCCTSMGVSECKEGTFPVSSGKSSQCCGYQERSLCRAGDFVNHLLAKAGAISQFETTKPFKCQPGVHGESAGEETYVNPFEVRAWSSSKWSSLSMLTYHRVSAVRVRPGNFRLAEGETLTLSLEAERFGQIGLSAKVEASSNEALQEAALDIQFLPEHVHKEFYIKFTMVRGASAPVVVERKVYVSGSVECGVGFFDDSRPRNCKRRFPVKSGFLTHDVPNYGIGIEYELVGIPGQHKRTGLWEEFDSSSSLVRDSLLPAEEETMDFDEYYEPKSMLQMGDSLLPAEEEAADFDEYYAPASMLDTSSLEAMNVTQHVTALPCMGECAKLKECLWQKARGIVEKWHIEVDLSVGTLEPHETSDTFQHQGVPFEIVSPPVVGMAGVKSATDVLQAISGMGAQAPLSAGLHIHVNMRSKKVGADITCSMKEIFAVWLNWVRYQNVIDEMQSPNRIGNDFARSLDITGGTLDAVRLNALRAIFRRGHESIMQMPEAKDEEMTQVQVCEAMIGKKTYPFCKGNFRLPHDYWLSKNPEKFLQLNLTPLGRFGTLEFRSGTASLDPERVGRWIQFIVAFVDTFKDLSTTTEFNDESVAADWDQLQAAQKAATPDDLKAMLKGKVEDDFFEYFSSERPFEEPEVAAPQKVGCVSIV